MRSHEASVRPGPGMLVRVIHAAVVVLAVIVVPRSAAAQVRAPYLQSASPTAITVAWRTAGVEASRICYGASPSTLTRSASASDGIQHEVRITGLEPGTRYYYAATAGACPPGGGGDPSRFFETAPAPGEAVPFRAWVVGDSGTGGSAQRDVRDAMLAYVGAERPDLFLHMGDMAYNDGRPDEFTNNFFSVYAGVLENTPCWPTMGNHEGHTADALAETGGYYDAYVLPTDGSSGGLASGTEAYYAFDYANVHFVVLESHQHDTAGFAGETMLEWLEADLASTDQDWIIAYWHHPPYTKGSHDSDRESRHIDMRQNVLPILEAHGVDLILGGHSHTYERSFLVQGAYETPSIAAGHIVDEGDGQLAGDGAYIVSGNGAVYVVAGHGGASTGLSSLHPLMYFAEARHGSCLLDVQGDVLTLTNLRSDGAVTDAVTLVKGTGLFFLTPRAGDSVLAGSTYDVTWTSIGETDAVRLELSLDDGATWQVAEAETPNDGIHTVSVPRFEVPRARFRLTDVDDPETTATSGAFALSAVGEEEVIPFGAEWEYHDQGVDQGDGWTTMTGGWSRGAAELGYGDGDEVTVLYDENPNIPTVYFRKAITLDGPIERADFDVLFDDGVAVWVNGTLIFGQDVDEGLAFAAYASGGGDDDQRASYSVDLSANNPFVEGENVIAAIVKQRDATSSDVSFDLSLTVGVRIPDVGPPPTDGGVASDGGANGVHDGGESMDAATEEDGGDRPGVDGGDTAPDGGGCGCRVTGRPGVGAGVLPILAVLGVLRWRRRR